MTQFVLIAKAIAKFLLCQALANQSSVVTVLKKEVMEIIILENLVSQKEISHQEIESLK